MIKNKEVSEDQQVPQESLGTETLSPFQTKIINFWVKLRTSFWYLWSFIGFCLTWIIWNRTHYLPHFDNNDLTYLNLLLSILSEISAITILVYTLRIERLNEKQSDTDHNSITYLKETLERIERKLDK